MLGFSWNGIPPKKRAVYGQTHDILFNDDKTVCMYMPAKSSFYINTPAVFLNGRRLSFTSKYKYLGTLMTHDGSDEANMSRQRGFFYARSNGLSKNFNACSPSVKATLFRTFCSNMYCGHLWHDFRKSALTPAFDADDLSLRSIRLDGVSICRVQSS